MSTQIAPWLVSSRWPIVPIRYVARLGTGHTPSRQHPEYWANCTIPWMTLADVWQLRDGTVSLVAETAEKISALGLENSAAVKHPAGTVILSRTASIGFSAILDTDMATSQDFATWTCSKSLDPRYLLYALRAMAPDLRRLVEGSTHKTIYMPNIAQLRTPLPPRDAQRRIVNFLDVETARIDRMLRLQRAVESKLAEREAALLDREIDGLANVYGSVAFRRFIRRVEQGTSPECANAEAAEDEWGVLKVSAVKDGVFQPTENKLLPSDVPPARQYEIRNGDLLITRANTPILVGTAAVARHPRSRLLLCDKIFRIHASSDLDTEFLVQVARGTRIRALCAATAHGTSQSMTNLKVDEIKRWPIPAVPLFEQRRMVELVGDHRRQTSKLHAVIDVQLALLAERRQALITAAVTGEIDVTTARKVST